jgi:hypothetical protein
MGDDANLAAEFGVKRREARATLRKHMEERGLHARDGWSIAEVVRQRAGTTELVMRPIHLRLPSPDDLECVVTIDEIGSHIDSECVADGGELTPAMVR